MFRNVRDTHHGRPLLTTQSLNIASYHTRTDFFKFQNFYSRLKNHITHFQLRLLVVCGDNLANGVFYPTSFYHDHNLEVVTAETHNSLAEDYHNFFKIIRLMPDEKALSTESMKLDCLLDSRQLRFNSNSRISSSACSSKFLANGTFEGGYILQNIEDSDLTHLVGEFPLTDSTDGITNHISISNDTELVIASNDSHLRLVDLATSKKSEAHLPFAVNCLAINPHNHNEYFVAADNVNNYILDRRQLNHPQSSTFSGHTDYGFACDWCPSDENLLLSGNQDGTVRLWDRRRPDESLFGWNSALGSDAFSIESTVCGGPVRNCKFSYHGKHIVWAESLDHVGIMKVSDLDANCDLVHARVQSIDFIGKCIGLNVCPLDSGHGEQLIIGVNDCPLGGILNYQLEAADKPLDFDFTF